MIDWLKGIAKRLVPGPFMMLKRCRNARRFRAGHGGAEYRAKRGLVSRYGLRVMQGPFADMQYGDDVNCGAYVAKLVGSYEEELHNVVEEIVTAGYARVIDVGCAEGYYAVGFARRMQDATIYAFDIDDDSRRYCRDLARRNGVVDRVVIEGFCGSNALETLGGPDAVVVCDCEGYEFELLDPAASPQLMQTDVLVELHEKIRPSVTRTMFDRFSPTHDIRVIETTDRDPARYPQLDGVAPADRPWAVREGRPWPMQWAWMTKRTTVRKGASHR